MHRRVLAAAMAFGALAAQACGDNPGPSTVNAGGASGTGAQSGAAGNGAMGGINADGGGAMGGINADSGGGAGGSGGGGGSGGNGPCGANPCADHTGSKDFTGTGVPANPGGIFDGAKSNPHGTNSANEPAIVYPSHETMFPINVSRIRHEWKAGTGNTLFRLRFVGPKTTVTVYTTTTNWEPTEEEWDWIAESNRGASVEFSVAAVNAAAPSQLWQSAPITLLFSDAAVEGAIYYWSTGTAGVMKALVSDPIPQKFYTDPMASDANTCVACHTLSRDGKRLAVGYGGEKLREASVPDRTTIVPPGGTGMGMASAWTTFSPDGKLLLVAANGKLTLINSDTGATVGANAGVVPIPAGKIATHPDWSALGDRVVITLGLRGGNKEVETGSIAILPYNGGSWGTPEVIVPSSAATDNNFFPVWSPDSQWIAYVNATGKSKDAVTAKLMLVRPSGGTPITMTRLNQRVNNQDGVMNIGNSMPTWAPSTKPGTFWVAFSSLRAYATLRPQDAKEDQIWIAAIDPTASDPGYSAFWAPFQSIDEGNHRAFWTHTDEDKQCRCVDICGDNLDNDCDGTADEAGCVSCGPKEICGDGIDNNCDCVVDDCHDEICDDGIDNDGDGLIDGDDLSCKIVQ